MIHDVKIFTLRLFYPSKAPERREVSADFSKTCTSSLPLQVKPLSRYEWKLFAFLDGLFIERLHVILCFIGLMKQRKEPEASSFVIPLYEEKFNTVEKVKKDIFDHKNGQRYQVIYKPTNPFSLVSEKAVTTLLVTDFPADDLPFQGYAPHAIKMGETTLSIPLSLYQLFACVKLGLNGSIRRITINTEAQVGKIDPVIDPSKFERPRTCIDHEGRKIIDSENGIVDLMGDFDEEQKQVEESIRHYFQDKGITALVWKDVNTIVVDLLSSLSLTDQQKENMRKAIALEWRTPPDHRIFYRASWLNDDSCIGLLITGIHPYSLSFQSSIFGGLYGKDAESFTFGRGGDLYALVLPEEKATKYFYAPQNLWKGMLSMVTYGEYAHPRIKVTDDTYGGNFCSDQKQAPTIAKFKTSYSLGELSRRMQKLYNRHLEALFIGRR